MGTADYIAAFAVEGKLLNVMNLWRAHDIVEVSAADSVACSVARAAADP